jgi:hypothetical protein
MIKEIRIILFVLLFLPRAIESKGQQIFHYQTEGLELVYFGNRYSYLVPHVVGTYKNAMQFHGVQWGYKNPGTRVMLTDFSDFGSGGATALPNNQVIIGIEPYSYAFSITPSNERFQWLFNHELTHISMADLPNRTDRFWRKAMMGKIIRDDQAPVSALWSYLTVPRWYAPRWYHEGIACFMETWMSGGLGRAMGGYDEMYFRSLVNENKPIYSVIGLDTEGTTIDFQVGANSYLYGTRFVDYLALEYGIDKLKKFYIRSDDSKRFYGAQFKKVYQEPVKKVWNDWIEWEKGFQKGNLDRIKEYPITQFKPIANKELGNISKYGYNPVTRKMYMAINHPGILSQIVEMDISTGKIRKLANLDSPMLYYSTHLAYDPDGEKIFISEQNSQFRSLVEIDGKTGKKRTLIRFSRTGDLAYNKKDRSVWGIMHNNGYSVVVRIPEPYDKAVPMYSAEFGKTVFDLALSNNGEMVSASLTGIKGEQSLIVFQTAELEKGIKKYRKVYELEDNTLTQFQFSPDDQYLIGTSYYTGVSNVFRIPVDGSDFQLPSNTESGFFMPLQITSDSMLVLQFRRDGMMPGLIPIKVIEDANPIEYVGNKIAGKYPEVRDWSLGSPDKVAIDSALYTEGRYHALGRMKLTGAYPDVAGFKNTIAAGYRLNFRDPVGISNLDLFIGTSAWSEYANDQKIHAQLKWRYWFWELSAAYNKTDFYDLFGPTKRSRAGYSAGINYNKKITLQKPLIKEYGFSLNTFGNLEVLPSYQNVSTPIKNLQTASGHYGVSKLRRTLGAVEDETGYAWDISTGLILAQKSIYPSIESEQSLGFLIPGLRNTSFWIRNSIGQSLGDRSSVLSHFYFGGFRNNYVDWQPSEQYRKTIAFPGVEIDNIKAYNYVKTMGELNLKPIRLRNVGTGWLYPTFIKSSLFSTHLITDPGQKDITRNIFNFGGQIDLQLVLFSYLKTTWSAGFAHKMERNLPGKNQVMFSVKLLGN